MTFPSTVFGLLLLFQVYQAARIVPQPENVRVEALNTQYTLKWDWAPDLWKPTVFFTAEYIPGFDKDYGPGEWKLVCANTTNTQCDFSKYFDYFGIYHLRVKAVDNGSASAWVEREFCAEKEGELSPPTITEVKSTEGMLEVHLEEPKDNKNRSMRDKVQMKVLILYWQSASNKVLNITDNSISVVTLKDLTPWKRYCMKAKVFEEFYKKESQFSQDVCATTTIGGSNLWWFSLLLFITTLTLTFVVILLCFFLGHKSYKVVRYTFFPNYELPANMQECLFDNSPPLASVLLSAGDEAELCCDKVAVLPEGVPDILCFAATSLETAAISHLRQGSDDSGVYSGEEGSGINGGASKPKEVA
ncbi:interferon alpha/beta receptor 1a-like [Erpetoichthys calabaricus]|uniref:Interferon alpha/beta receptor 1a-like n=1 Tax=Erpetoichthys calabaricus TaxID=27687 RepID=A0A8C4TEV7_ERPCA|nr:interferon alpha/beta receptor 1a-like [Erpetoichthys calabaricus]